MERLIAIENFFIVKPEQLEEIALNLGVQFTKANDSYILTLILTNIFAYLVIYLFIKLILKISKKIFRRRRRHSFY